MMPLNRYWRLLNVAASLLFSSFLATGIATAEVRSELRTSNETFLSPAYNQAGPESTQFFGAAFTTIDPEDSLRVDLRAAFASGAPLMSYINIKELAYSSQLNNEQSFSIGRKKEKWSELDRRWNYGLIEPVFKWNPLSPEAQGLTGLFWNVGGDAVRLSLFGSLIFVPEQGASFEIDSNGQFVRGNPWFRRPPDSIRIFSTTSKIEYDFDRPSEADIVFQPTYGARLELFNSRPWLWRASGFYKPMNQLALGYKGVLDIPRNRGSVEIHPESLYHQVFSTDLIYQKPNWRTGLSVAHDIPSNENPFDATWTRPVFEDATLFSVFVDFRLTDNLIFAIQKLDSQGGQIVEEGQWASQDRASITSRYPYREATALVLDYRRQFQAKRVLQIKSSYVLSQKDSFQLVRLEGRLDVNQRWSLQSDLSLVEAKPLESLERNDISEFRNNDRMALGVGYAF